MTNKDEREITASEEWTAATAFWRGTGDPCRTCGGMSVGPVLVREEGFVRYVRLCTECGRRE